jgi:PTH1 family peptidyl-tRNA hydrolase
MPVSANIRLVAGLGNPGRQYEATRHNAGFWFVDRLARGLAASFAFESRFGADVARAGTLRIARPQTFMNESGRAVGGLARFFGYAPDEVLVVHDELDLAAGEVRLKRGGGVAGHNGLRDIQAHLGTADFWRLRIGIGHPRDSAMPAQAVVDYVLKPPRAEEADAIERAIDRALAAWPAIAAGDMSRATQALHTREAKPAGDPAAAAERAGERKVAKS